MFLVKRYDGILVAFPLFTVRHDREEKGIKPYILHVVLSVLLARNLLLRIDRRIKITCFFPEKGYNPNFFRLTNQDKVS